MLPLLTYCLGVGDRVGSPRMFGKWIAVMFCVKYHKVGQNHWTVSLSWPYVSLSWTYVSFSCSWTVFDRVQLRWLISGAYITAKYNKLKGNTPNKHNVSKIELFHLFHTEVEENYHDFRAVICVLLCIKQYCSAKCYKYHALYWHKNGALICWVNSHTAYTVCHNNVPVLNTLAALHFGSLTAEIFVVCNPRKGAWPNCVKTL